MAAANRGAGLVDTDILIDAARGVADAQAFLAFEYDRTGVSISIISAMELVTGCRNAVELAELQSFLRCVDVIPVEATISERAMHLMEQFSLSHGLRIPDALIGATALTRDTTLYTKNVRHFQVIPQLRVHRPY